MQMIIPIGIALPFLSRVFTILYPPTYSFQIPDDPVSPTIEALILLHSKVSTLAENHQLTTRLVVPSNKVGCILGEGGKVITEMRRRTGAEIRVYSKADKPKYLSFDEELVQVIYLAIPTPEIHILPL